MTLALSCFIAVTVLFGQGAIAQSIKIREIRQANPITKEIYVFPHATIPGKKVASKKINNYLRQEMLGAEPGTPEKEIFNDVWKKDDFLPTLQGIDYTISRNDQNIISLQISAEGCGAYCEPFSRYFNFNPATGNPVTLDSIFTVTGVQKFIDSAAHYIRCLIEAKIKQAKDSLLADPDDKPMKEYYREMIDLYSECLSNGYYAATRQFRLNGRELTLLADRCSAHFNRNLDELWNFEYSIHLTEWKQDLTVYGKKLALSVNAKKNPNR